MATLSKSEALQKIQSSNGRINHTLIPTSNPVFTLFPKLPLEVRHMIWSYAANLPRIVDIHFPPSFITTLYAESRSHAFSTTPPPVVLRICQESRYEGLKVYELSFGVVGNPEIYFNFSADTLLLSDTRFGLPWNLEDILSQYTLPSVAIDYSYMQQDYISKPWCMIFKASAITEFTIIYEFHTIHSTTNQGLFFFESDNKTDGIIDNANFASMKDASEIFAPWMILDDTIALAVPTFIHLGMLPSNWVNTRVSRTGVRVLPKMRKMSLLQIKDASVGPITRSRRSRRL